MYGSRWIEENPSCFQTAAQVIVFTNNTPTCQRRLFPNKASISLRLHGRLGMFGQVELAVVDAMNQGYRRTMQVCIHILYRYNTDSSIYAALASARVQKDNKHLTEQQQQQQQERLGITII